MKIKRLLFLAVLCIVGMSSAWADTDKLTTANGWQKVTDLGSMTLSDYYFAFVDNNQDLMLSFEEGANQSTADGRKTMVYRTGQKAEMNPAMLWVIEGSASDAMIRNVESNLFMQCETDWNNNATLQPWYCHTNDVTGSGSGGASWAKYDLAYADSKWTIRNKKVESGDGKFIGPWNDAIKNGAEVAANKSTAGTFQIYAIERSKVNWVKNATEENPANMTYKVVNANAYRNSTNPWTTEGDNIEFKRNGGNGFDGMPSFFEPSKWGANSFNFSVKQALTNLPIGAYKLRIAYQGAAGTTFTMNIGGETHICNSHGDTNGTIGQTGEVVTAGQGVQGWGWEEVKGKSLDGNLTILFNTSATTAHCWANFDNVELYLLGTYLLGDAVALPDDGNMEAGKWYYYTSVAESDFTITATTLADIVYTTNGDQCTYNATGDAVNASQHFPAGKIYIKSTSANNIKIESANYEPGQDFTAKITNPGFETGNTDGWTVTASSDTGAKSTTDDTYKAIGSEGSYLFNNYWQGTPLTQNIGKLPAGIYQLSAMVATGDTPTNRGITFLTVNSDHSQGHISRNGEKRVMGKETMTFVSDGTTPVTIGVVGGSDEASGNEFRADGYFWYKADDFHLTYVNTTDELFNEFTKVLNACKPWAGSTKDADYVTAYNTYSSYTDATPQADLLAAINYMNTKYDVYAWDNASLEHPYLMPNYVFGFDNTCKTNDGTTGSGRTTPSTTRPDGSTGLVWSANGTGCTRSSSMTLPYQGIYKLQAKVKKVVNETHHVDITIDGEKTENYDLTQEWADMDIILGNTDYKESNVQVFISSTNGKQDYVFVGGIDLYYTGLQGDFVKGETHYYYGNYATVEATDEVPVVDATLATGVTTFTRTNPNGLCYVANDATLTGDNVVKGNTCATLVLTDGNPFKATKNFEATSASYEMTAIAGDKFGTLMLPFAVNSLPGKVYTLDQGVNFGEEIHATEANAIAANAPVLVTKAGTYSASNVTIAATNDTYTNGELVGTYKATPAIVNTYVLQKHSDRVAFFMVNTEGVTTVNPFRAYIKAQSAGVKAVNIIFDDEETGLDLTPASPKERSSEQAVYDLAGRRVQKAQKGVYVVNGKKVLK